MNLGRRQFARISLSAIAGGVTVPGLAANSLAPARQRARKRRLRIQQVAEDGDNNAFFPSAACGKLIGMGDGTTVMGYATGKGAAIWRLVVWNSNGSPIWYGEIELE